MDMDMGMVMDHKANKLSAENSKSFCTCLAARRNLDSYPKR
jgi:hypothetical protein